MTRSPLAPPRLVLRIGSLGNRRFGRDNGIDEPPASLHAAASQACTTILEAIQQTVTDIHLREVGGSGKPGQRFPGIENRRRFWWECLASIPTGRPDLWARRRREDQPASVFSTERPLVTLLAGFEPGGDTIARTAALALNDACRSDEALATFAHVPVVVVEAGAAQPIDALVVGTIPTTASASAAPASRTDAHARAETARARALGFRAQSEALRHHADVLIAIWDPDAEGKPGGTAESVALALRERVPVVAVRLGQGNETAGGARLDFLRSTADLHASPASLEPWAPALTAHLRHVLAFPDPPPAQSNGHAREAQHYSSYHPRVVYHAFLENVPFPALWPDWPAHLRRLWARLRPGLKAGSRKVPTKAAGAADAWYGLAKERASEMSAVFGDAYRSGILASYGLGAAAVLLALSGYVSHQWHVPGWLGTVCAGGELLALLLLASLWRTSMFQDWHEAYTDARILAEALRCMGHLAPLGVHTPMPKLPPHLGDGDTSTDQPLLHDPRHLWSVWYVRALIRQAPMRLASASPFDPRARRDALVENWIGVPDAHAATKGSQIAFHRDSAARNHRRIERIERMTTFAFIAVVAAAGLHFTGSLFEIELLESHVALDLLLFACVGLPAALAALTGYLSQIEAIGLKQRSDSMMKLLAHRSRVLSNLDLQHPESVEARWLFPIEAAATAGLMIDETADWALIYKNSDIHAA